MNEVWKQQTLLQLLQIVEMPMLDCILASPDKVQAQASRAPLAAQDLVISNTCLERELPDTLNLPQWVLSLLFVFPAFLVLVPHLQKHSVLFTLYLQFGWVAVSSGRLLGALSRWGDCICRGTTKPTRWRCLISRWANDKPKENSFWCHCQVLQWTG